MQNDDTFSVEELEERLEMEAAGAPLGDVDPDGFYCRCGWEQ